MKGELLEQHHSHHPQPTLLLHHQQQQQSKDDDSQIPSMVSKLHQHSNQNLPFSANDIQLSRDADDGTDCSPTQAQTPTPTTPKNSKENSVDRAIIEVVRRPRGRPPGSKNKPKPPVIVTREPTEPTMSPYIFEVHGGSDIVEAVSRFSRRRNIGICVLTGSGTVSNVTLRQPATTPVGPTVTFHGRLDILSISATFLPQPMAASIPLPTSFTLSLAGPQGQIVGGIVAGSLIAAGTVFIIAATFTNPSYHRLPADIEERNSLTSSLGVGEGQPRIKGSEQKGDGSGIFSCHLNGRDIIWAPAARTQPPRPPY